jgi:hypothetical protein
MSKRQELPRSIALNQPFLLNCQKAVCGLDPIGDPVVLLVLTVQEAFQYQPVKSAGPDSLADSEFKKMAMAGWARTESDMHVSTLINKFLWEGSS